MKELRITESTAPPARARRSPSDRYICPGIFQLWGYFKEKNTRYLVREILLRYKKSVQNKYIGADLLREALAIIRAVKYLKERFKSQAREIYSDLFNQDRLCVCIVTD